MDCPIVTKPSRRVLSSSRNVAASSVKQWIVTVDKKRKPELFCHLLRQQRWTQVLVFAKTRNGVDALVERLQGLGINADGIHWTSSTFSEWLDFQVSHAQDF